MTTRIEWADETWNPFLGCSRISTGCLRCYAEAFAARGLRPEHEGLTVRTPAGVRWSGSVRLLPERLEDPLRWRKPRRVFVGSMGDLFHDLVPFAFVDRVLGTIERAPRHTFLFLTKRPGRALVFAHRAGSFPENVHFGVTVEDQAALEERLPILLRIPAAVRYLSAEPLLGGLEFPHVLGDRYTSPDPSGAQPFLERAIDGVIVGGESGPRARPCLVDNVAGVVRQCDAAGVPVFVKQLGSRPYVGTGRPLRLRSRKGADPAEWPFLLRRRELPEAACGAAA